MNWWYLNIGIFAFSVSLPSYAVYVAVMSLSVLRIVLEFLLYLSLPTFFFSSQHDLAVRLLNSLSENLFSDLMLPLMFCMISPRSFFLLYLGFLICHLLNCFEFPECQELFFIRNLAFFVNICIKYLNLQCCIIGLYWFSRGNKCDGFVSTFQSKNECL